MLAKLSLPRLAHACVGMRPARSGALLAWVLSPCAHRRSVEAPHCRISLYVTGPCTSTLHAQPLFSSSSPFGSSWIDPWFQSVGCLVESYTSAASTDGDGRPSSSSFPHSHTFHRQPRRCRTRRASGDRRSAGGASAVLGGRRSRVVATAALYCISVCQTLRPVIKETVEALVVPALF